MPRRREASNGSGESRRGERSTLRVGIITCVCTVGVSLAGRVPSCHEATLHSWGFVDVRWRLGGWRGARGDPSGYGCRAIALFGRKRS